MRPLQCHICCVLLASGCHCRDSEGQQQKLASDHDAHPREEPDFPELAKLINRYVSAKQLL